MCVWLGCVYIKMTACRETGTTGWLKSQWENRENSNKQLIAFSKSKVGN